MGRLFATIAVLLGAACAQQAPLTLVLPMAVPEIPAAGEVKHEPYRVGTVVVVPGDAGRIDLAALDWSGERGARFTVEWPGVAGMQLLLEAEGRWDASAQVRVLDAVGEPLHIDTWRPAQRRQWWSAATDDSRLIVEIDGWPGDGAGLRVASAAALR
jgi:hypothetical protein